MIRTQIYINDQLHQSLQLLARQSGVSMASVARQLLQKGIRASKVDDSGISVMLALTNIKARGGPKDLSKNIDHYLYGSPKKRKAN